MDDKDVAERLDADPELDDIRKFFVELSIAADTKPKTKVIEDLTFDGLTSHWKGKGFKNIITMVGAGISTSAGIPDFRSPGSGLYDNLQKYNLPHPTSIFDMEYFLDNPKPFFALAKELYPGKFNPTPAHYFVRLLAAKGLLVRHYTQNIDTLERVAKIPEEKLVEAHGTFYTNHCLRCKQPHSMEWVKKQIFNDEVPTCPSCKGLVKPDIVFFGENMPENFFKMPRKDFKDCDLLIIMGTSLEVQPFASLIDKAGPNCIRLLINRDKVGVEKSWFSIAPGLKLDKKDNTRDVAYLGNCDDGVYALADALGWGDELRELVKSEHAALANENITDTGSEVLVEKENAKDTAESSSKQVISEKSDKDTAESCSKVASESDDKDTADSSSKLTPETDSSSKLHAKTK